jgi:hypothetical protein
MALQPCSNRRSSTNDKLRCPSQQATDRDRLAMWSAVAEALRGGAVDTALDRRGAPHTTTPCFQTVAAIEGRFALRVGRKRRGSYPVPRSARIQSGVAIPLCGTLPPRSIGTHLLAKRTACRSRAPPCVQLRGHSLPLQDVAMPKARIAPALAATITRVHVDGNSWRMPMSTPKTMIPTTIGHILFGLPGLQGDVTIVREAIQRRDPRR